EDAILAVVILLLFLRHIRATIIAAISLPLSIFPAFWALDILGFSLNLASFMLGIAGQFFKQFGITVSVQVFFSLLAARFVTPVLAAYFLKDHAHDDPPPGRVLQTYTKLVTWSVRHHLITVLIG